MQGRTFDYIKHDATIALIVINVAIFIVLKIGKLISISAGDDSMQWLVQFALSSDIVELTHRPWVLLTYMFTQTDTLHLFFNVLWLFCFGRIIGSVISYHNLLAIYLIGGICGGCVFVMFYELATGSDGWLMGSSASVIAIAMSAAVIMPKRYITLLYIGKVRVLWIVLAVIIIILIGTFGDNLGGTFAHMGGLLSGLIYGFFIRRSHSFVLNGDNITAELDGLLEKVKLNGYSSLSSHEQSRLFELSTKKNTK